MDTLNLRCAGRNNGGVAVGGKGSLEPTRGTVIHVDLPLFSVTERKDGGVSIGALVSEGVLASHPVIQTRYPRLADAMRAGSTWSGMGGDQFVASAGNTYAVLSALGAEILVEGLQGVRTVAYADRWMLPPGDLVVSIELPPVDEPAASTH